MVGNDKQHWFNKIFSNSRFSFFRLLYSVVGSSRNNIPIIQANTISSCSLFLKLFTINNQIQYPIVTYIYIYFLSANRRNVKHGIPH